MVATTAHTLDVKRWDWRTILFALLAGAAALLYLTAAGFLLAPWQPVGDGVVQDLELHRWHVAVTGAVTALFFGAGLMPALLWRPRARPLLVQYSAVAALLGVLINAPFVGPFVVAIGLPIALLVAAYPAPGALREFSREGPFSRPLLALSLAAAVLLAPVWWHSVAWQIQGVGGEQATTNQWIADFEHTLLLVLAGLAASTKRPGWRVLGLLTGITFLYLGVAALLLPTHPGSWGTTGGVLALLGGAGYLAATLWEARRTARAPATRTPRE